jgi:hypothetical protein
MFGLFVIIVLVAAAAFFVYNAKTSEGWDWKKGAAAFAALGGAVWFWLSGFTDKF